MKTQSKLKNSEFNPNGIVESIKNIKIDLISIEAEPLNNIEKEFLKDSTPLEHKNL